VRYLIHFSDGGSGMRSRDEALEQGVELDDGGGRYRVVRVEEAPNPQAFGHVWRGADRELRSATAPKTLSFTNPCPYA
jgi:hypothetical protein